MPAKCEVCGQEMELGGECLSSTRMKLNGKWYQRVRMDSELERQCWVEAGVEPTLLEATRGESCHDCGVRRGALHHPGCDMERCPRCHRQFIGCDCA